jgi:Putative esterase
MMKIIRSVDQRAQLSVYAAFCLLLSTSPTTAQGSRLRLSLESKYQPGALWVDFLTPDSVLSGSPLKVIYVLPVEPLDQHDYGDSLDVIQGLRLQNEYNVIFVAPAFARMPWYADHPSDPLRRQESYLLRAVIPLVESRFPVLKQPLGRLLLGFSKSGWGAFSLLLRHPDIFGAAAAWDAPLDKLSPDAPDGWQMIDIFGTQENFNHYCVFRLLREHGQSIGKNHRFVLLGYGLFQEDVSATHALMAQLGIPHIYYNDYWHKHAWDTGWVPQAVSLLLDSTGEKDESPSPTKENVPLDSPRLLELISSCVDGLCSADL